MAKIRYIVRVVQADKEIVLRVPVAPETTVGQLQAEVLARANKKGFLGTTCELSVAGASLDEADHLEDVVDEGETIEATLASAAPTPAPAGGCKACVAGGGASSCLPQCAACGSGCTNCIDGGGGTACAARCC